MKIKGLIFDLDGVIVKTSIYHYYAWKKIAGMYGIEFGERENEKLKGVSRVKSLEILLDLGKIVLDEEKKAALCRMKNEWYLAYIDELDETAILPGADVFIRKAKEAGYLTAIGSASKNTLRILEKLQIKHLFDTIVDGNAVTKPKPDPEVFLKGASNMRLSPSQCVVFEDSEAGIEAAKRAGMYTVGIGRSDTLKNADIVIPSLGQGTVPCLIDVKI